MIAHIVTFKFVPNAKQAIVQEFHDALTEMRKQLGDVVTIYLHGPGLGLRDGAVDYGIVSIVRDEQHLHLYLDDEAHQAVTARFAPLLFNERQAVQINVPLHLLNLG